MWDRLFIGRKYKCVTDCLLGGNKNVGQIVYWEEIKMWDRLFIGRKYKCVTDCLLGGNINEREKKAEAT